MYYIYLIERVTIATRHKFCEKLKNENRLRMKMRIEWRIGLYEKCRFLATDIFITGNCSIKKLMLNLSISCEL